MNHEFTIWIDPRVSSYWIYAEKSGRDVGRQELHRADAEDDERDTERGGRHPAHLVEAHRQGDHEIEEDERLRKQCQTEQPDLERYGLDEA